MKKFTKTLIAGLAALTIALTGFVATNRLAFADNETDICNLKTANNEYAASEDVRRAAGCKEKVTGTTTDLTDAIMNIVNGVLGVLAVVAVIVIIIGGVQYMTSTGDATKTKKARDTILYASIGLVIVGLAAIIVNFVIAIVQGQPINRIEEVESSEETSLILTESSLIS